MRKEATSDMHWSVAADCCKKKSINARIQGSKQEAEPQAGKKLNPELERRSGGLRKRG